MALFMHTHAVVNFPGFQSVSFEVLGFSALAVNHFYWRVKVPEIDGGCASFARRVGTNIVTVCILTFIVLRQKGRKWAVQLGVIYYYV